MFIFLCFFLLLFLKEQYRENIIMELISRGLRPLCLIFATITASAVLADDNRHDASLSEVNNYYLTENQINALVTRGDEDPRNDLAPHFSAEVAPYISYGTDVQKYTLYTDDNGGNWMIVFQSGENKYLVIEQGNKHMENFQLYGTVQKQRQYAHPDGQCQNINKNVFQQGTVELFRGLNDNKNRLMIFVGNNLEPAYFNTSHETGYLIIVREGKLWDCNIPQEIRNTKVFLPRQKQGKTASPG